MKNIRAYCELSMAMAMAGSSVVIGKIITTSFPVFLAAGLRFGIAAVILLPLLYLQEHGFPPISKKDWGILTLQALTGVFLFTLFLLYGLRFTSAAEGGIITSTTPAVLGVISFVFLKERLSSNKIFGICLTMLGILVVNGSGNPLQAERGLMTLAGNLLIFGAVVGEALFTIFRKVLSENVSPLATATWVSVIGFVLFLPFAIYEAWHFDFATIGLTDWMAILYYGVVVTVIAFILWFQGVAKVSAGTAAVFTGVMPVSAIILSYLILREPFLWTHIIGGCFVLTGIGFVTVESRIFHLSYYFNRRRRKKGGRDHVYSLKKMEN